MELILASTSPYRQQLLQRLTSNFRCIAPEVDETALKTEAPGDMALRLANAKASEVAQRFPSARVIGSDQVAAIDGIPTGKPGSHAVATAQLAASAGKTVRFYTGLALIHADTGFKAEYLATFDVHFRQLSADEIENYLRREQPYDCAGSFKCEGLGIALFERLEGDDPTALEGLPLIATCRLLRESGLDVLTLQGR